MNISAGIFGGTTVMFMLASLAFVLGCKPAINRNDQMAATIDEAIVNDDLPTIIKLKERGYDLSQASAKNPNPAFVTYTPLSLALRNERLDIVDYLLTNNINVNATNSDGSTALFYADSPGMAKRLVDDGANLNATIDMGRQLLTPLNSARLEKNRTLVNFFVSKGARDPFKQADIWFPDCELKSNETKNFYYAFAYGGEATNALIVAAGDGDLDALQKLLDSGADINVTDSHLWGSTPLAIATLRGNYNVVDYLISKGANINVQNNTGATPLMQAVAGMQSNVDIAWDLIQAGANLQIRDSNGFTVFDYAGLSGNTNFVEMLRQQPLKMRR